MHPLSGLRARLGGRPLVLDGGLATEVERRGTSIAGALWSARALIEAPHVVRQVHLDYLRAGADIVSTATYQAAASLLVAAGVDAAVLLARGVSLAQEAREQAERPHALVAASMGPYGAHRADGSEYRGDYGVSDRVIRDHHLRQAELLWRAGPDVLAFETVPSRREGELIAEVLAELGHPPAWLSFSVRDAHHLSAGDDLAASLGALAPAIGAVGLNCAAPELLAAAPLAGAGERLVYANSGEQWSATERSWSGAPAARPYEAWVSAWLAAGATILGGCCRTTPDDIAALARSLA